MIHEITQLKVIKPSCISRKVRNKIDKTEFWEALSSRVYEVKEDKVVAALYTAHDSNMGLRTPNWKFWSKGERKFIFSQLV